MDGRRENFITSYFDRGGINLEDTSRLGCVGGMLVHGAVIIAVLSASHKLYLKFKK